MTKAASLNGISITSYLLECCVAIIILHLACLLWKTNTGHCEKLSLSCLEANSAPLAMVYPCCVDLDSIASAEA